MRGPPRTAALAGLPALPPMLLVGASCWVAAPLRCSPVRLCAPASPPAYGHVFVVHGDVLSLSADALLVPTRNLANAKWFPDGPPRGAVQPPRDHFTPSERVIRVDGIPETATPVWLGHLDGRFAPEDRRIDGAAPDLGWFLEAASQFLSIAHADLRTRQLPPRCSRAKHVLAMPILGTGKGGARASSGAILAGLLQLVDDYARENDVDVALVVKNDRMFSAAQAQRRQLTQSWEQKLGARLADEARHLAALAASERLCLFLGAGVSVGAGLPEWKQLLSDLANRPEVALDLEEIRQLGTLGLPDQAAVVASRLRGAAAAADGGATSATAGGSGVGDAGGEWGSGEWGRGDDEAAAEESAARADSSDGTRVDAGLSDGPLASLIVDELSSRSYSITHGLLAGLPISAVVTTNYDNLFETAWRAANKEFNVLPYETQPSDAFILKLHGDLHRPEDIVLTRSQMLDSREQRKALSGIVQTMLLTKHLLYVGFSLQDPNFSEVAGTVRRARREGNGGSDREPFGTLLTLHNRPFLAELWPELNSLPIDLNEGLAGAQRMPNPECARLMEIFLDKVSLDSSTTTRHLLDGDFGCELSPQEDALKRRLQAFRERVAGNELARQSSGFAVVRQTPRRLGDAGDYPDERDTPDI